MKKILLSAIAFSVAISSFSQWTTSGTNVTTTGNVGIGTTTPTAKLDVNGDAKATSLHLRSVATGGSHIYYPGGPLYIGSPQGVDPGYLALDLQPGGYNGKTINSYLTMWSATGVGNYDKKVQLRTDGISFFNGGNVGIGTNEPTAKLEVSGDAYIRQRLKLGIAEQVSGMNKSYLETLGFLVLGLPKESHSDAAVDLVPGTPTGTSQTYSSRMNFYINDKAGGYQKKAMVNSNGISFFNGGNVGIGTDKPTAKLDVDGDLKVKTLYIQSENTSGWLQSKIYYPGHSLIIGSPVNTYISDNALDIKPGGSSQGKINSAFTMYTTLDVNNYEKRVQLKTDGNSFFNGGNVGIGTDKPTTKLDVNGNIRGNHIFANEVKIEVQTWSDFVFDKEYKLPSLKDVEAHINEHKHLPNIPSEKQVLEEGVSLGEMQAKLLQKIEELTLYVIDQDKKIKNQNEEIENLKKIVSK